MPFTGPTEIAKGVCAAACVYKVRDCISTLSSERDLMHAQTHAPACVVDDVMMMTMMSRRVHSGERKSGHRGQVRMDAPDRLRINYAIVYQCIC